MSALEELTALRRLKELESKLSGAGRHGLRASKMSPEELNIAKTKDTLFADYLRKEAKTKRPNESDAARFKRLGGGLSQREAPSYGESLGRAAVQGGFQGWGDELVAGGAATLDAAFNGDNFADAYKHRVAQERSDLSQFRETDPWAAHGTEIGGAIATGAMPWMNAARGGQYAAPMRIGAGQGLLYGAGAGEGDLKEQLKSEAVGTILGTIGGGISVPVSKAVGAGVQRLMGGNAAKDIGMSYPEWNALNRQMSIDDSLRGQGQVRLERGGEQAMLADSGRAGSSLLDEAISESPLAANAATKALQDRVAGENAVLKQAMDNTLGVPQGLKSIRRGISKTTASGRSDAYEAAYNTPIDYASPQGREIETVLNRMSSDIKESAFKAANERMLDEGITNQQIIAKIADDGTVSFSEMPNVIQLDYLKRSLQSIARSNTDDGFNMNSRGVMMSGQARSLRDALIDAVPDYADALKLGQDKILREEALALGSKLLRPNVTRETVDDMAEHMSDEARESAAAGIRSYIDETVANVKRTLGNPDVDAKEAAKVIKDLSSNANKQKIAMIIGDEKAAALFKQIDESSVGFELQARVAEGSKTAMRTSAARNTQDVLFGGPFEQVREGSVTGIPKSMWQSIMSRSPEAKQQISDEFYFNVVKALTGPRGADARKLLQQIESVQGPLAQGIHGAEQATQRIGGRSTSLLGPTVSGINDEPQPYLLRGQ